ncbi:S-methyl-5'-thioadenosine phosphorylase isoform 7 [Homo sapiens]|uniref:Isoform 5 of S-methyl-5'-thioadenosine phosphorylase n=1 Tax=Homo sapiens TaxID=9606 RepID=Q13126-5|nr:S-methyl-5'-thioadenosine phosphorylase isoform 7 [Homo sapiens]CCF77348.1 methylthioadenosine phosphorylase [Homo sapiens]
MASGTTTTAVKIGIIGGTGLDDPEILEGRTEKYVDTPFGKPSDALILGKIKNVDCVLLARHGRQHTIMPSKVNYQANIWALKEEGCTHVIVTTACGSLREEIQPGDIVIIDQFIDRTTMRPQSFYDGSHSCARGVCHIPMAEPFCPKTREVLIETAKKLGLRCHSKGTMVTIEGPRFSSRAESFMFRTWGADVINMTTVPEVVLAKEAGICYASIAMATDYDCWKEHEEAMIKFQMILSEGYHPFNIQESPFYRGLLDFPSVGHGRGKKCLSAPAIILRPPQPRGTVTTFKVSWSKDQTYICMKS